MRTVVLAVTLAGCLPAAVEAQQLFDYHTLLDSTVPAATASLTASGHRADPILRRPDGQAQLPFVLAMVDSSGGTPRRLELGVTLLSQGDRVTRVVVHAASRGADTVLLKTTLLGFVNRLTAVYGRPLTSGEDAGWCWSAARRWIDLTLDRSPAELGLNVGIGPNDR